ncbi:bifunctional proline dehydrogenase/L-glutamate gamma-semialdehyde dehydrogenase [Pelagicoccus sp. SDUM812003]|uniref:bifunctional proline dehydrogenase/L-glutamate gamma-semialdehyde dehydrogenase n=1 Tax=Pelagicoccus sp. SDUM812003 TaxID=3041267 RepID=UPI0028100B8D|nr:bifunctional proline dehydrogenase/L-glutamate gamma-semialdehyde dehydrogenase [Pelagicoccus sp. SDUM812003]MDQ8204759.1 bifunctional proline dehydrogenase/L-glutamate gamma-semialdehyde dehydrogenase [Pelagicoccus sp. SDUM812003]
MTETKSIVDRSVELAESWLVKSNQLKSKRQKEFDEKVAKMVRNPVNKVFLTELIDQSFRPIESKRIADQLVYLLKKYKNVDLFDSFESLLIELFQKAGRHVPKVSVPAIVNRIRSETAGVILEGEKDELVKHIRRRRSEKTGVNLNIIGEALLGEQEAEKRIQIYLDTLAMSDVNYISIKISTIYSQINSLAFEQTVELLVEKLTRIFQAAKDNLYRTEDGSKRYKFVNLDMEEYRDLALTVEAFKRVLEKDAFRDFEAGIVLQAYLPDSFSWQRGLTEWAQSRVAEGGAPIKLRVVKGANMDMEQTEASMRHWPQAPFHEKIDSDANYKRMLDYAMTRERAACVKLGIASHNLFELAHARLLSQERSVEDFVVFEMLEGMADATVAVMKKEKVPVLLYAPVATRRNFTHAIAYYVRRLDENTSAQNFLTHSFDLKPEGEDWNYLSTQFRASFDRISSLPDGSFRLQNRSQERYDSPDQEDDPSSFVPEPDTDWTLGANVKWARSIVEKWKGSKDQDLRRIPISVGGDDLYDGLDTVELIDQSQYEAKIPIARYALAEKEHIDQAMETASKDESGWAGMDHEQRHAILRKAATELRKARGDLIGVAAAEVGKLFVETDVEVSEAIDFAEFYPFAMGRFAKREHLRFEGKGVGVVIPPWNFPIAIPAGGVLASLAAGNNTLIKPSPQATYCSWLICKALWRAGVPKKALQFLPCRNDPEASYLTAHPKTGFVIFTGSTRTALGMLRRSPRLSLYAETGGKNAMVVSAAADRDKAIADIVQSAFGNAGQKCSATSLVILHRSLYNDKSFRESLVDAAKSLPIGYAWDFKSKLGPLANPVGGALAEALVNLKKGEQWLLKPEISESDPHLLSPGVLWGVTQESYCYRHELFGPVIGVMPYDTIEEAIRLVNETNYGLTSGLHSLDEREIARWREEIRAGNLYINRGTTGAIVMRQPFGGMAKSAIGPGIKVGGWNYPLEFANAEEIGRPVDRLPNHPMLDQFGFLMESFPKSIGEETTKDLRAAFESSLFEHDRVFSRIEDYFRIRGETNQSRYLKLHDILLRIEPADTVFSIFSRLFNALLSSNKVLLSISPELDGPVKTWFRLRAPELGLELEEEPQSALVERVRSVERIRFASPEAVSEELWKTAAKWGVYLAASPPQMDGRLELLLYFREQCVTHCYHRYGNLGQHQLNPHAEDVLAPGALPDEVYRGYDDDEDFIVPADPEDVS